MNVTATSVTCALAVTLLGCGGLGRAGRGPAGAGLDPQLCVERALRGDPDPDVLRDAFQLFGAGCERGDQASCSALGVMYERGLAVDSDPRRAVGLYERACADGNDPGCTNLGRAYATGVGVALDETLALSVLVVPCFADHAPACGELGSLYAHGRTIERDLVHARSLLERACLGDHTTSCFDLGQLFEQGVLPNGKPRAVAYYQRACAAGLQAGCRRLDAVFAASPTQASHEAGQVSIASQTQFRPLALALAR